MIALMFPNVLNPARVVPLNEKYLEAIYTLWPIFSDTTRLENTIWFTTVLYQKELLLLLYSL